MSSRLRVGLLIDSMVQPMWVRRVVEEIVTSEIAAVVVVVENREVAERSGLLRRVVHLRHYLLYGLYRRIDEWMQRRRSDAFATASIEDLVGDVPRLAVLPVRDRGGQRFTDEDLAAISGHHVDVLLRFGFGILRGGILHAARHGVWSYHHGDNTRYRGQPAGVWEVLEGAPVTGTVLQVLNEDLDNGRVLYRSYSMTSKYSAQANRNRNYWKAATFVMRMLRDIHEDGGELQPLEADQAPALYSRRMYRTPNNLEMARGLGRIAARVATATAASALWREQWFVAYRFGPTPTLNHSFHRFKRLVPPPDRFWADPFPMRVDGRHYIFFEEYLYATRRAHISVVSVGPAGASAPIRVLERPYHLSYPFMFEWEGRQYMVPETSASNQVELYGTNSFPAGWTLERVLLEGVAGIDPTLVEIDGTWWMFLNVAPDRARYGDNDELHLYFATSPFGPWRPHPRNPIRSDVKAARPAGRLFRIGDEWYRPSQDSSSRYGYAMRIHRIQTLTRADYAEVEVAQIHPEWRPGLLATHTFNQADGLTCIDGLVRRLKR